MPKIAKELTAQAVKHLPDGTHALGGVKGFYLRKNGYASYYLLRYLFNGTRKDFTIGSYSSLSLAQAKVLARKARELVESEVDPIINRREIKEKKAMEKQKQLERQLFRTVAEQWLTDRVKANYWVNNKRGESRAISLLTTYAYPALGKKEINKITAEDIRDCIAQLWQEHTETAKKLKSLLRKIFQWAIALKIRTDKENPADMSSSLGILMESLQNKKRSKENHSACAVDELPELMKAVHRHFSFSAKAFEFAILTASRTKAVRLAQWKEFNLEKGIWVIPVEHDKIKAPNRDRTIFLSKQAIQLLQDLPRLSESEYIFPAQHGGALSTMALTMFLRGLHEKRFAEDGIGWIDPHKTEKTGKPCIITVHGTARATFRTWAKDDELGNNRKFDQEAVELCLLHSKNDAYNGAYDRAKLEKERRFVMDCWGKYCYSRLGK
jgi:integrase